MTEGEVAKAKDQAEDVLGSKIVEQIEYYFGDINLPRDKFLQDELKLDDGWVPILTMLKFNRLAKLSTDQNHIAEALKKSRLMQVSDDGTKIRRNPLAPLPEDTLEYWNEVRKRTVYVKGFPPETTLDEIQECLKEFNPNGIIMRKKKTSEGVKIYKSSVFVILGNMDEAKNLSERKDLMFKEINLLCKPQEQYKEEKRKKRTEEQQIKKQKKKELLEEQKRSEFRSDMVKNCVIKACGFKPETKIEDIKEFFKPYGEAAYVCMEKPVKDKPDNEILIRFSKENEAKEAIEKILSVSEGKLSYKDESITVSLLEGDEEEQYWAEFSKARFERASRVKPSRSRNKDHKEQFKRKGGKRKGQEENSKNGESESKKAKRIVFKDDDDEEVTEGTIKQENIESESVEK